MAKDLVNILEEANQEIPPELLKWRHIGGGGSYGNRFNRYGTFKSRNNDFGMSSRRHDDGGNNFRRNNGDDFRGHMRTGGMHKRKFGGESDGFSKHTSHHESDRKHIKFDD